MKFKKGDYVQVILSGKKCEEWKCNSLKCPYQGSYGVVYQTPNGTLNDRMWRRVWVNEMRYVDDECTGCSGFIEKDLRKVSKKEYEQGKVKEAI